MTKISVVNNNINATLRNYNNSYSSDKSQSQRSHIFDLVDVSPTSDIFPKTYYTSQQSLKNTQIDKTKANFNASLIHKYRFQPTESHFEIIYSMYQCPEQGSVR